MQELNNPYSSAEDITEIISSDPAMTFRILKMANSAYYGFPRSITTVTESIVLMGFSTVRNLMLTTMMYQFNEMTLPAQLKKAGKRDAVKFDRKAEWRHSVATAIATREIILQHRQDAWEHLGYLAGLMHDIGKIFFCSYLPDDYRLVQEQASARDSLEFSRQEEEIIGAHHGQVGAWIVDRWNLPKEIVEPISLHHFPEKAKEEKELTQMLYLGNLLAQKIRDPKNHTQAWNAAASWLEKMNLTEGSVAEVEKRMAQELKQIETFMAVA
jgi:HD-like signal output (HDOD) protein